MCSPVGAYPLVARSRSKNLKGSEIRKTWRQHAGHGSRVLDLLRRHPFPGLTKQLAPARIVLQRADPAPGYSSIEVHVGAIETVGGVVEAFKGERRIAFSIRDRSAQQQRNRIR